VDFTNSPPVIIVFSFIETCQKTSPYIFSSAYGKYPLLSGMAVLFFSEDHHQNQGNFKKL